MRGLIFLILILVVSFLFPIPSFASNLYINEFLANPSTGNKEWVEFYNPDQIDLTGYFLDDDTNFNSDSGSSSKKSLSSLNNNNPKYPFLELNSSMFNNSGDYVVLFSSSGQIIDQYQYTQDPGKDITIGRSPDGGGWATLVSSSQGGPNDNQVATPIPSPTSTISPTLPQPSDQFIISNAPSQIDSLTSFSATVNLSLSNKPNIKFYLKGAFKKDGSSNYFGFTKVGSSWIKNNSSYDNQFPITTDSSGNWSGDLTVMPDTDDSGFSGSGDYIFKVTYYTSDGSGPNWSNETTVNISFTNDQDNTQNSFQTSNKVVSNPSTFKPPSKYIANLNPLILGTASSHLQPLSTPSSQSADIPKVKSERHLNYLIFAGIGFIFIGLSAITFIYYRFKIKSIK